MRKIAVFGARGFIGQAVVSYFRKKGDQVIAFSRKKEKGFHDWQKERALLEGTDVVINLMGESIIGRWNRKKSEHVFKSRIDTTRSLVSSLLDLTAPPALYIAASAVGYYGERANPLVDETNTSGKGPIAHLTRCWEESSAALRPIMRVCYARFGMVLGDKGGALPLMKKIFKIGLGGKLGSGKQYISWIAIDDLLFALDHIMQKELQGPINFSSPYPITNKEYTSLLAKAVNRPAWCTIPQWLLFLIFKQGASFFLMSLKVIPTVLLEDGFCFSLPRIEDVLKKYLHL